MNYRGLQRRAKGKTINKSGKISKKKRFAKSLSNKARANLLTRLNKGWNDLIQNCLK